MRRSLGIRTVLVALLAGILAVPAAGLAARDADGPRTVPLAVALKFDVVEYPNGACQAGAYWQYHEVNGASTYTIQFLDGGREVTYVQPPFDTAADAAAPKGAHRAGLTGYSASAGGCGDPVPGWRGRFQLVRATALVELKDGFVVGRVTKDGRSLKGIVVSATGPPDGPGLAGHHRRPDAFEGVTNRDGRYRIRIPKSKTGQSYSVGPHVARIGAWAPSQYVSKLSGKTVTVNFAVKRLPPPVAGAVGTVVELKTVKEGQQVKAELFRDGRWVPLDELLADIKPGDRIRTDKNTVVAVEFDLGGRLAVKPGSEIEITGERSVEDKNRKFTLTKGGVWAKCGQMKESLEIQTTGGVMGIKG